MEQLDEPKGWRVLQTLAQEESDPQRLASIIDEMNHLLDRHEKMIASQEAALSKPSRNKSADLAL